MSCYIVSDMLTRIRNAQRVKLSFAFCHVSKFCSSILDVLKEEGFIKDYKVIKGGRISDNRMEVNLKYYQGVPVIRLIQRVSKQSVRHYTKIKDLPPFMSELGVYILSTPLGVMSDKKARELNVGGEIICKVF